MDSTVGRAFDQAVRSRTLTADALVQFRTSPCDICGRQSDNGTGFAPSASDFPCQYHCTDSPYSSILSPKLYYLIN